MRELHRLGRERGGGGRGETGFLVHFLFVQLARKKTNHRLTSPNQHPESVRVWYWRADAVAASAAENRRNNSRNPAFCFPRGGDV